MPAVGRLSLYLRELESVARHNRTTISSKQLGQALGLTDAQVRKDLAYFGQFGQPGIGYQVGELITRIRSILGTDKVWRSMLAGAGNLGRALLSYRGFGKKGFHIVAVFDSDPDKIGRRVDDESDLQIESNERMAELIAERNIQIGILAVPADAAQDVANQMVQAGIRGILNFAPASVSVPENVSLTSVDLALCLEQLVFRVSTTQTVSETQAEQ
jgi:redox-sensing transcriptional repressor